MDMELRIRKAHNDLINGHYGYIISYHGQGEDGSEQYYEALFEEGFDNDEHPALAEALQFILCYFDINSSLRVVHDSQVAADGCQCCSCDAPLDDEEDSYE